MSSASSIGFVLQKHLHNALSDGSRSRNPMRRRSVALFCKIPNVVPLSADNMSVVASPLALD
jgi:hypothetical protein